MEHLNEIGVKTSEASDGSQRGQMGSGLWGRSVQLGVCLHQAEQHSVGGRPERCSNTER